MDSNQPDSTPVTRALDALGVPYRTFTHPGPVHSLEQAAAERGQRPEQVIRSILFRLGEGDYVMVLVAGPGQLSWAVLRKHLGVSRMSMASEEEVLAATGAPRGPSRRLGCRSRCASWRTKASSPKKRSRSAREYAARR